MSNKLAGVGFAVPDEWIGCILLADLSERYEPMIMGLESSGVKITGDSIKAKILQDVRMEKSGDCEEQAVAKKPRNPQKFKNQQNQQNHKKIPIQAK